MNTDEPSMPADTSMMRIVHQALRRDLDRAARTLAGAEPPDDPQRTAIARHLGWMMGFLEAHHASEDNGLYPVVLERRPDAAHLLDTMDRDHREVATVVHRATAAAEAYEHDSGDGARRALLDTINALRELLYAHLRREEDDVMPIVASCMTRDEWYAIEHEHNIKPKTMRELGFEGHWLIDDVDDADRSTVLGVVPSVPRCFLLHGFARAYRRRSDACWHPARRRRRIQHHGDVSVEVEAPPQAVWDIVRDPTRVGEWSHECIAAEYLDGAEQAAVGVRFRGRNRQGHLQWGRTCEVISIEPHRMVWRTVPTTVTPDSSVWSIQLIPTESGTRIEQRFDVVKDAPVLEILYATVLPAHRDREAALEADLRRLGDVARRTTGASVPKSAPSSPRDDPASTPRTERRSGPEPRRGADA